MENLRHTILCIDDEPNILKALQRLFRKEGYRILTATTAAQGLRILAQQCVHLVISDQRMPDMSGTQFLDRVKAEHPDTMRIILSGYTDVDAIAESINTGHIFKFFLKPWKDRELKLEIRKALQHYDLVQANRELNKRIVEQNRELTRINENLEQTVKERTRVLELQNRALELSHAIVEDLPIPIMGVSAEGLIVLVNRRIEDLSPDEWGIEVGKRLEDCFPPPIVERFRHALASGTACSVHSTDPADRACRMDITPLGGKFRGKGVILSLRDDTPAAPPA